VSFNSDKPGVIGKSNEKFPLRPIPVLSTEWLSAAQEDSPEFRIALALAAMRDTDAVGALRCNLEVVTRTKWGWDWAEAQDRYATVWSATSLPRNLQAVLERRMVDASRAGLEGLPLESHFSASAEDVTVFLAGQTDDARLEEWLWGLMLIDLGKASHKDLAPMSASETPQPLPRAYALLKLLYMPKYQALQTEGGQPIQPVPTILSHLRAQRLSEACQLAARRLRASGHVPMPGPASGGATRILDFPVPKPMLERMAAALLIPVSQPEQLQKLVLRPALAPKGLQDL
jgi:CRISPR-associated protein Csx17